MYMATAFITPAPLAEPLARVKAPVARPAATRTAAREDNAMIKAAAERGWIDGERVMMESLMAFRRAGCDGVLTYFAPEVARVLQRNR